MKSAKLKLSEGSLGATIVATVLISGMVAAVVFATSTISVQGSFGGGDKYPVRAFVVKRMGSLEANTVNEDITTTSGLSIDVNFDEVRQKLKLKIKNPAGQPMKRVSVKARARKIGQQQISQRLPMKEYPGGEYRSDPMNLDKGGWVLTVSAYDLYRRGENKLLFYTERPLFLR